MKLYFLIIICVELEWIELRLVSFKMPFQKSLLKFFEFLKLKWLFQLFVFHFLKKEIAVEWSNPTGLCTEYNPIRHLVKFGWLTETNFFKKWMSFDDNFAIWGSGNLFFTMEFGGRSNTLVSSIVFRLFFYS